MDEKSDPSHSTAIVLSDDCLNNPTYHPLQLVSFQTIQPLRRRAAPTLQRGVADEHVGHGGVLHHVVVVHRRRSPVRLVVLDLHSVVQHA